MKNFRDIIKFKGGDKMSREQLKDAIRNINPTILDWGQFNEDTIINDRYIDFDKILFDEMKHFKEVTNVNLTPDTFLKLREGWFDYAIQPERYPYITENLLMILKEMMNEDIN